MCVHIKAHSGLFISYVDAVDTKGNAYIKGCSDFIITLYGLFISFVNAVNTKENTHIHTFLLITSFYSTNFQPN